MSFNIFDMEEYLEDASDEARDPVELLLSEFIDQARSNHAVSAEEFISRHPFLEAELRELLPMIEAVEDLKKPNHDSLPATFQINVPNQLGDYRIIREIGRGGMGIVYEAEQLSLGRHVALKLLPPTFQENERRLKRFQREAETAAKLHHNHIVQVFGVGHHDEYNYFVMQLIEGDSLERLIIHLAQQAFSEISDQAGHLESPPCDSESQLVTEEHNENSHSDNSNNADVSINDFDWNRIQKANANEWQPTFDVTYWRRLAILGHQVADALCYAHAHNVLHRDIKPANLLIDGQGDVWVTDFGLAKLEDAETISQSNDVVGTLRYMAPEQFQGTADARSDVYSLGMTLYEFITLKPGFDESEKHRLIHQILNVDPPRTRSVNSKVPRDLDTIVMKAIARNPADRYQSANAFASDLRRFLENRPIAARPISAVERVWRWSRKNPAIASLTSMVLIMLIAISITSSLAFFRTRDALNAERFKTQRLEASSKVGENLQLLFGNRSVTESNDPQSPGNSTDDPQKLITSVLDGLESQFEHQSELTKNYQELLALLNDFQAAEKEADLRKSQLRIQKSLEKIQSLIAERTELTSPQDVLRKLKKLRSFQMDDSKLFELSEVYFRLARDEFSEVSLNFSEQVTDPVQQALRETKIETGRNYLQNAMANLTQLEKKNPSKPEYQFLLARCHLELDQLSRFEDGEIRDDRSYDRAIEILEKLVASKYATQQYRRTLRDAYLMRQATDFLGNAESIQSLSNQKQIELTRMESRLKRALEISEQLSTSNPKDQSLQEGRIDALIQLGQIQLWRDESAIAKTSFNTALKIQNGLSKQNPTESEPTIKYAELCVRVAELLEREPPTVRNGYLFKAVRAVEILRQKDTDQKVLNRLSVAIQSEWSRPQVASPN